MPENNTNLIPTAKGTREYRLLKDYLEENYGVGTEHPLMLPLYANGNKYLLYFEVFHPEYEEKTGGLQLIIDETTGDIVSASAGIDVTEDGNKEEIKRLIVTENGIEEIDIADY